MAIRDLSVRPPIITCLFLLLILSLTMAYGQKDLRFFEGSTESLRAQAKASKRPFLLYFYASWSEPCQQMDRTTYQSPSVIDFLNQHFLVQRINGATGDRGLHQVQQEYGVFLFPTLVICSAEGEVLDELSGYMTPESLVRMLGQYVARVTSGPTPIPMPRDLSPASQGFGVQVGVYGDYENVQREVERLQSRYQQQVQVFSGRLKGSEIHRVVIGPFDNQVIARRFLKEFQAREQRAGIVKDLSRL